MRGLFRHTLRTIGEPNAAWERDRTAAFKVLWPITKAAWELSETHYHSHTQTHTPQQQVYYELELPRANTRFRSFPSKGSFSLRSSQSPAGQNANGCN